jgi:hypothetical protein
MRFVFDSKGRDQPHGKESIMFSKRVRLTVFVAIAASVGGVFAYVTPASNAERARLDDRPGIADNATNATISPWSDYLSEGAVDSGRIENDLDGNASALVSSDCIGLPGCGNPRQP